MQCLSLRVKMLKLKFICCLNHICVYLIGSLPTENLKVEGKREMMRYGIYVYPTLYVMPKLLQFIEMQVNVMVQQIIDPITVIPIEPEIFK